MEQASYQMNDAELGIARKDFSRLGLGAFLMLAVTYGVQIVLALMQYHPAVRSILSDPVLLLVVSYVPMYCVAVPLCYAVIRRVPAERPQQRSPGKGQFFRSLLVCFFFMYGGNLFGTVVNSAISESLGIDIIDPVESLVTSGIPMPALFVLTVICAPVFEELVFRRFMIDRMAPYGQGRAIAVSALMFGLFHANLSQFFYAMALGLVFGYIYASTGRMRYSVFLHMIINFWGGIVSGVLVADESVMALINGGFSVEDLGELAGLVTPAVVLFALYTMISLGLAIAGLVVFRRYRRAMVLEPAEKQFPRGTAFKTIWINVGMLLFVVICLALMVLTIYGV